MVKIIIQGGSVVKKDTRLYNMIFPTFMLLVFSPVALLLSVVGNFVIDSVLIVIISLFVYQKVDKKFYLHSVFVAWGMGFVADGIGFLVCLFGGLNAQGQYEEQKFVYIGIAVAALFIFFFDYFITFSRFSFDKTQLILSSAAFAILTAPYTFLIPNSFFYGS